MWIVKIALSRPCTFIVSGLLILILSPVVILQTPTDIFPNINVPVVAVSWEYDGIEPRGNGRKNHFGLRARADDDGEQH